MMIDHEAAFYCASDNQWRFFQLQQTETFMIESIKNAKFALECVAHLQGQKKLLLPIIEGLDRLNEELEAEGRYRFLMEDTPRKLMPRAPTPDEVDQIAICVAGEEVGCEKDQTLEHLAGAAIAVFDGYISDGPGYNGKVATVVWPGGPELFSCFTFNADGAIGQEQDLL